MALIYAADLNPSKADAIAGWLPSRTWAADGPIDLVGAFRFDDPDGEVGMETHLVRVGSVLLQVPLTYRGAPLDGAADALVCEMEHSILGRRWVYDGVADPVYLSLLATTALTNAGQAAEIHQTEEGWAAGRPTVHVRGGGWSGDRVPLTGFGAPTDEGDWTVIRSPELELRVARRPGPGSAAPGLTGTWAGQDEPVVLAEVRLQG